MRDIEFEGGANMQIAGIGIQRESCLSYNRLIMAQHQDSVYAYIYEVIVDDSIVASYHGNSDSLRAIYNFKRFSGIINIYDLRGSLLRSFEYLNGSLINQAITSNCVTCSMAMVAESPSIPICIEFWWLCYNNTIPFPNVPTDPSIGGGSGGTTPGPILGGPCSDNGSTPPRDENGYYYSRINELTDYLHQNEFGLIPCGDLLAAYDLYGPMFQQVSQYQIPSTVLTRIDSIRAIAYTGMVDNFNIEDMNSAYGEEVNCDFFPIKIDQLPLNLNNVRMTPDEFLENFRKNINNFINPNSGVSFMPYTDMWGVNEAPKFDSPFENCLGSIIHITIPSPALPNVIYALNGSVVISDYTRSFNTTTNYQKHKFKFSTMETLGDGEHPVAGNREFGIYTDPSQPNKFVFYTMGVDRTWDVAFETGNSLFGGFDQGYTLWSGMQEQMIQFINSNGGSAGYYNNHDVKFRPDWNLVQKYLRGEKSLDELKAALGC